MGCPVCGPPIPNFDIGCPVSDTILSTLKRHLSTFSHILPKEARLFFWGAEGSYGTAPRLLEIGVPAYHRSILSASISVYFVPSRVHLQVPKAGGKPGMSGKNRCPFYVPSMSPLDCIILYNFT